MSRGRDPLRLSSHWHVDCRIETDLPEDTIIGANFLINIALSALALGTTLILGWMIYHTVQLRSQIAAWDQRIAESRPEVKDIQKMQREYVVEAGKIDRAYEAMRPSLFVTEFLEVLGSTLPPQVTIDMIEWNETGIIVRGNLREPMDVAAGTLNSYKIMLANHPKISRRFRLIHFSDLPLGKTGEIQKFALIFTLQPLPSL